MLGSEPPQQTTIRKSESIGSLSQNLIPVYTASRDQRANLTKKREC